MEKKQDSENEVNLGLFILRMNLSSDSEADLEEERENKMVVGPKNEPMDEAEVPGQHEPQNDNCAHDTSSKAVAKRRSYKKKRVKWGARDEIVMCSAVVDGIKCGSTLPVPSLSLGNPSPCEGYQTGASFTASTDYGVENHNGMKDKEHAGGKNKQLHDRISMLLNEIEQNHEQGHHDMLSKSEKKSGEWNGDQFVTDDILTGSRILEEPSDHQSDYADYAEVVKRLDFISNP